MAWQRRSPFPHWLKMKPAPRRGIILNREYYHNNSKDLALLKPNGDIRILADTNSYPMFDLLNWLLPGFGVESEGHRSTHNEQLTAEYALIIRNRGGSGGWLCQKGLTFHAATQTFTGGGDYAALLKRWKEARNQAARIPNRRRYWVQKAREKGKHKLTTDKIMAEQNVSIRVAMIHAYGMERFMIDAKVEVIDTVGEYELLRLPLNKPREDWRLPENMVALKMRCPSTGDVHIHPVSPDLKTVSETLDWKYQCKDYLGRVGQHT